MIAVKNAAIDTATIDILSAISYHLSPYFLSGAAKREKPVIFAVGNAPTALIQIYEMMQESNWRPAFVIGVPVGFVNVEAAKELILQTEVPYIINRGRKGGSNVAAAICNALLYELRKER